MKIFFICLGFLVIAPIAIAKPAFTGANYSGIYDCTGNDSHEGKYTGTVTMELVPSQSLNNYGAFDILPFLKKVDSYWFMPLLA